MKSAGMCASHNCQLIISLVWLLLHKSLSCYRTAHKACYRSVLLINRSSASANQSQRAEWAGPMEGLGSFHTARCWWSHACLTEVRLISPASNTPLTSHCLLLYSGNTGYCGYCRLFFHVVWNDDDGEFAVLIIMLYIAYETQLLTSKTRNRG